MNRLETATTYYLLIHTYYMTCTTPTTTTTELHFAFAVAFAVHLHASVFCLRVFFYLLFLFCGTYGYMMCCSLADGGHCCRRSSYPGSWVTCDCDRNSDGKNGSRERGSTKDARQGAAYNAAMTPAAHTRPHACVQRI